MDGSVDFANGVPFPDEERPHDDALMKAQHIWLHRPRYFWAVCPTRQSIYSVEFGSSAGFRLKPAERLPTALEWN